jgi:type IV pilus assembly protein PilC
MPLFNYKVKNTAGETLTGVIETENEEQAVYELKLKNYFILEISSPSILSKELSFSSGSAFLNKIKPEELVIFTRQFSILINSGMNLMESLAILAGQSTNKKLKMILTNIIKDIEGGLLLSEALQKHTDVFSRLYISMVSAGEAGGVLDKTLNDLSVFLEKESEIRLKIKNKTAYPKFVMGFAVVVVAALIIFIVPAFKDAYEGLGAQLPLMTRAVLAVSQLFKTIWFYLTAVAVIIGGRFIIRRYIRTKKGRLFFDRMRLKIPGFGAIIKKIALSRFARTLGILISAGVPILKSLDVVRGVSNNMILDNAIDELKNSIRQGENIAIPLSRYPIFPPMFIQMVNVGEKSGSLDEILLKISDFYDNEVSHSIEVFMTVLEPLMLLLVAGMVAFVVIAMYLPMFKIYQFIS